MVRSAPRAGCRHSARSTHQNVEAVGRRKAIVGREAGRNPGQWRFAQEHFAFRQCPRRSHAQALAWHGADADGAIIPAIAASVTAPGARSGQPCGTRNGLTPLKLLRDGDRNGPQESCHAAHYSEIPFSPNGCKRLDSVSLRIAEAIKGG